MCNNCSIGYQEEQATPQDYACYRFAIFRNENVPDNLFVFNCVINFVFLVTAILGNVLVISAVWKTPSLRSPSTVLLCGLATTDLVVGLVVQPLFLSMELIQLFSNSKTYNCALGKAVTAASFSVCGASLLTVTVISIDRLLAIQYHLRYAGVVTVQRVIYAITLNWLISGFLASFTLLGWEKIFLVVTTLTVAICLCVSTYAHAKIYRVTRRHQQQIQAQAEAVQAGNGLNISRYKRSAANALFVYYFLLLCYTPLFITLSLSSRYGSTSWKTTHSVITWKLTTTAVYMNSSVNPFIYCWRLQEMRAAVKRTLRKIFCRA